MKKLMMIFAVQLLTISALAQVPFVQYNPVIVDNNGNRVNTDGTPYNQNYNNQNYNQYHQAPTEVTTTRGIFYSKADDEWFQILIKVDYSGRYPRLVGVKGKYGEWEKYNDKAQEVSFTDDEYLRRNFCHKVWVPQYGRIYF